MYADTSSDQLCTDIQSGLDLPCVLPIASGRLRTVSVDWKLVASSSSVCFTTLPNLEGGCLLSVGDGGVDISAVISRAMDEEAERVDAESIPEGIASRSGRGTFRF